MIRPLSCSWPPLAVMPSLRRAPGTLSPSIESGSSTAVTTVLRSSASPKISSPIACGAGAGGAGEQLVAGEDVLQALLEDHVERDVEADEQRDGGREGGVALALGLEVLGPVEVVAAARGCRRRSRRALSETDANARPGGHMSAFWEPATTTSIPHSSWRSSAAPRPETASTARITSWRLQTSAIAWTSWTMPVLVSRERGEGDVDLGVLGQEAVELRGVETLAPAGLVAHEIAAVGLGELDPALAELAGRGGQHGLAGADEVGGGRLHRAGAAGGEDEHVVLGLEDLGQLAQHPLVELDEGRSAVVEHRRGHRLRDGRGHGRRPGGHQVLLHERVRGHGR